MPQVRSFFGILDVDLRKNRRRPAALGPSKAVGFEPGGVPMAEAVVPPRLQVEPEATQTRQAFDVLVKDET
jgi:hypothetical protein